MTSQGKSNVVQHLLDVSLEYSTCIIIYLDYENVFLWCLSCTHQHDNPDITGEVEGAGGLHPIITISDNQQTLSLQ